MFIIIFIFLKKFFPVGKKYLKTIIKKMGQGKRVKGRGWWKMVKRRDKKTVERKNYYVKIPLTKF